jgi:fructose-1,6-bisphosphatase I
VDMMTTAKDDLAAYLAANAPSDVARVLTALAEASITIADRIRLGALAGAMQAEVGPAHDGMPQTALDVFADDAFVARLKGAGVRGVVSEERDEPVALDPDGTFLVALDPLDGSSSIDANVTIGSVFSVLDAPAGPLETSQFLQRGTAQRAAGLFVYGPQVAFVFTFGRGVAVATLDPGAGTYRITTERLEISAEPNEFAINVSNFRHWPEPVRAYVEDCLEGEEGPRGCNFNMRWIGSMVAEVYRVLARGGVYLYPEDSREGYEDGRLRLLYEANPVAFLVEQAGGAAIDGWSRILDIAPKSIHARTPLIFGSQEKVERIMLYYTEGSATQRAPLFGRRGLLRR